MKGRKKLPQELLDLRGTARKDRARPYVATQGEVAEVTCWTAPGYSELTDTAKSIYRRCVRAANSLKILTAQDLPELVAYAREYALYLRAIDDVEVRGPIYSTMDKDGNCIWRQNPMVAIANGALRNLLKIGSNFGFSPVDRQRLKLQREEDPMKKIKSVLVEFEDDEDADEQGG